MKLLQKKINFSPSSIENHFEVEQISFAFLISISFAAIFFQLGNRSFENRGYIIYAEVAREMIRSGDWIVPRLKGEIYLHKPILLIWFIAIPSALFGKVTPFFARLPSAISALFGIALTFYLGKRMFNDYRSGLISSFILLSSKEYFWQAKTSRTDMLLTFFILASLLCFYTAFESSGRKRFYFSILFYINIAFATLTKGPPGILFPMGTVIVFLIANKRIKMLFEPGFISGFFIFWAIILSYIFIYFNCVNPSAFLIKFKAAKILTRPEPFYY
ncbi:MAG: glycosyltransferase family 39 protein, partial [Thermodesulfobacteriota bacterium]|nr:glycosyltransferase family 39 protein [Thermodesulfobacteriota bacterium]